MAEHRPAPLPRRVLQTFVAPRELFRGFGEHAPWIGPLALSLAVALLLVAATPDEAFEGFAEGAVSRRGEPVTVTSDLETIARYGRLLGMLTTLVRVPLTAFVAAGVLMLLFGLLLRGGGTYRQYLAVVAHASLVTALGALVALGLALLRDGELHAVSPALLLPPSAREGLLFRVLSGVDLFTVWALGVAGVGVSVIARRESWVRAAAILVGLYLLAAVAVAVLGA